MTSRTMKTIFLLLLSTAGLVAQSLAVTNPANGSVVTWGFPLTAVPTSLPSLTQVRFYVDGRLECVANALYQGGWTCPKLLNATWTDERAATIYAEGYNAVGAKIATSSTNTFRLNNTGVNAVSTFNFGGVVTRGATIGGTGTFTQGSNATVAGTTSVWNVDGTGVWSPVMAFAPMGSAVNTSTNQLTGISALAFHNGMSVNVGCSPAARNFGGVCAGVGSTDLPAGLASFGPFYLVVDGPGTVHFTTTLGGPTVVLGTQGLAGEYVYIGANTHEWLDRSTGLLDTAAFSNGVHRFEQILKLPALGSTGTFTFPAVSITTTSGIVAATNFPLVQGQTATCSGTCPAQWTGTLYTQVQDANDFCFSSSAGGPCIGSLTGASGTLTITFTVPATFQDTVYGSSQFAGTDINEFTFSNGNSPQALKTKYSRIVGIAGDTFTLAPYYLNCDGTTTALSATHPIYFSSDTSRATVSSSGVVTLVTPSNPGHALISVIDALSSTSGRNVEPIDVEVRADRTTFNHLSNGHGILSSFTPGQSKVLMECYTCISQTLTTNPFPKKYLLPAFTAMQGGPNFIAPLTPNTGDWAGNYSNWLAVWNGTSQFSLAGTVANAASIAPMMSYGAMYDLCHGFGAWSLYKTPWVSQALNKIFNDVSPYFMGWEHCDEQVGKFGPMLHPRGDMGSGQDGLGHTTLGGLPAGIASIVVTGCASTPCSGTGTVNGRTWPFLTGAYHFQIQGASTAALNGPYVAANPVYAFDNPLGGYVTSFQMTTYDVLNGTYNSSTDPGLIFTQNSEGYDYGTAYVTATGHTPSTNPAGGNGQGYSFADIGASMTCSSNVCTIAWVGHPFTSGQVGNFAYFTTAGLTGFWRSTSNNANSVSFRVASVADGTYGTGTDANSWIDAMGNLPQTFVASLFGGTGSIFTGARPPIGASMAGGINSGMFSYAAQQGTSSTTDFVMQNATFDSQSPDRYGTSAYDFRNIWRVIGDQPFPDGSLPINLVPDAKPFVYETVLSGQTCTKYVATIDCRTDQLPGDKIDNGLSSGGDVFLSNILIWLLPNPVGLKVYQYNAQSGFSRVPPGPYPSGSPYFQTNPNEVDQYSDQWIGYTSVSLLLQHEDKYLLSPLLSSPDQNQGPGPFTQVECQSHTASYGNAMLCVNLSEEKQTVNFDLSLINPGGTGGPMRRWILTPFGDTVTSLATNTTSDTQTLLYAQAVLYISQTAGAADDLKPLRLPVTPAYGSTKVAVEVHYGLNDKVFQTVDCGTGACPSIPVNLHNLDVYIRKRFTKSDGTPVMVGDLERIPAQ
jgi:hypothetical protein